MYPVEKIGYSILLLFMLFIAILPPFSNNDEQIKYCRIDSISSKARYEVMPQLDYTYHTSCGPIPAGNSKHKVGDSIEIKIVIK